MKHETPTLLAVAVFALAIQLTSETAANSVQSSVQDLGVTEGKPITNGFVFIDGKYIEPPYIVTRQGNGIFINGQLVEQPCPWPIPERPRPIIPTDDPKLPQTIHKQTSKWDKDLGAFLREKRVYLSGHKTEGEVVSLMAEVYSNLPCVSKVKPGPDKGMVDVTWSDGETEHIRLILPKRKPAEWTRETVLERTGKDRANYEDRLNKGDYYFLGSAHGRMTGTADGARMVLSALLPILKTSRNAKEVQERMAQTGFSWFDDRAAQAFFSHRSESKDLESRVEKLKGAKL